MTSIGPGPDYTGCYRIAQGDLYLSTDGERAITQRLNIGGQFVWKVTHADPPAHHDRSANLIYPGLHFNLLPSGSMEPIPGTNPLLTLGGINERDLIPILVAPPMPGPSISQEWTLSNVEPKIPLPPVFTAYIVPSAQVESVAATGPITQELPGTRRNVEAMPKNLPMITKLWTFERMLEE